MVFEEICAMGKPPFPKWHLRDIERSIGQTKMMRPRGACHTIMQVSQSEVKLHPKSWNGRFLQGNHMSLMIFKWCVTGPHAFPDLGYPNSFPVASTCGTYLEPSNDKGSLIFPGLAMFRSPWKLAWNQQKWSFGRWHSFSMTWFSGSSRWFFQGVSKLNIKK